MTAEDFYQNFKAALDYLGCDWGDKEEVTVELDKDMVRMYYADREAAFTVTGSKK